eukprot:TRINITY_DN5249_c0_g1_i1.p1 TRINITY_DN5249_c0_g1~~TRINITY_DN5249_c0_g1_i1.p1  ORF type:complete len:320 (+),score=28.51 TRINITY_DN5249_c0_g1_i1:55-1014(+)
MDNCSIEICHGHGVCDNSSGFFCDCDFYFLKEWNCSQNVFHVYHDQWIALFHPISLLLLLVTCFVITCYYIYIDIRFKKVSWGILIRLALIAFLITHGIYHLYFLSFVNNPESPLIAARVDNYFYQTGLTLMLFCLLLTMVIWINILTQVKKLKAGVSTFLKVVRPIIIVYSIATISINLIGSFVASVYTPFADVTNNVSLVLIAISLFFGSGFSLYAAYLINGLKKYVRPEITSKYPVVLFSGIMGYVILLTLMSYVIFNFREDAQAYLCFTYIFLLFETVYTVLIILMLDTGNILFTSSSRTGSKSKSKTTTNTRRT